MSNDIIASQRAENPDLFRIRELLLEAATLASKAHDNATTLVEHNLTIDLENACRNPLALVRGILTNREDAERNRLAQWVQKGTADDSHKQRLDELTWRFNHRI